MTIAEISITPIGKGESVSKYVRRAVKIIAASGLDYELGPMGTCVEGDLREIFRVVLKCCKALDRDCSRLSISIKIDHRKGKGKRMRHKMLAVIPH